MDSSSRAKIPNKPKQSEKEIKTFDMEGIYKCFEYALTEGKAYFVLLSLTVYGGVRLSEALGIMWEDIDFTTGEIIIRQQLCYDRTAIRHKTNRVYIGPPKESVRKFAAAPQLLNILKDWKVEQEQNKKQYGRAYQDKVFEDAHLHGMRRTLVTKLVDGGVPLSVVSQYIGHADIRTTELYYLNKKKLDTTKVLEVVGKI